MTVQLQTQTKHAAQLTELLTNREAASYLKMAEQTLRRWACYDTAPGGIRPVRIGGRLRWKASDLQKLIGGEA